MAYYEAAPYDPNSYYHSIPHSASEETLLLASSLGLGINDYSSGASYPLYDPDSPFNSPIVPIRTLGKDGRLQTSLGVGQDGVYSTSPLVFGKSRGSEGIRTPRASTSYIGEGQEPSPAATPMLSDGRSLSGGDIDVGSRGSTPRNSIGSLTGVSGTLPLSYGMGIGRTSISSASGMNGGLELDYGGASEQSHIPRNYGSPIPHPIQLRQPPRNVSDYPIYAETQPLQPTFGRGRSILPPSASSKFVEHRFPISPPLQTGNGISATGRRSSKTQIRHLSKAKSCSSLAQPPPAMDPVTPVLPNRPIPTYTVPGVPYNSPVDKFNNASLDRYGSTDTVKVESSVMPFSFADLYNFGLAVDSVEEIDPRKSPYQFANDLLLSENTGINSGMGGGYTDETEFNALHSLPTPYLAHGSGFSSPSSIYLSDTSPELGMAYLSPGQLSSTSIHSVPSVISNPMISNPSLTSNSSIISGPSIMTSNAMIPAASLEYHLSPSLASAQLPPPNSASRQRCLNYASQQSMIYSDPPVDTSHLQSPTHQRTHSRALSSPGVAHFSYPSRFTPDIHQNRQHLSPYQAPTATNYDFIPTNDPGLFLPPLPQCLQAPLPIRNLETFERNLETFDDIYDAYSQSQGSMTPGGKRSRGSDDEDHSGDYVPGVRTPGSDTTPRKKLRTVASAPNLTSSKRMRPGPKPKIIKSPQQDCQSVFSAITSPPLPSFRRMGGNSPYHSDGEALYGSDDEFGAETTGSVPKEVIRSLYSGVAGHSNGGVKVSKRYVCLIEGCDRTFPRKSAIESHIQTHLEDKPFVCPQPDW